jgi:hypothetical protein
VDDEVRIVQGTYVGNFVYASTQANGLSVLGGYTAGCASRTLNPVNTILDGNQTNRVLVLSAPDAAADFLVEGLTLRNGKRTAGAGGGLLATVGSDGVVTLNNNQIENNTTVGYSYEYPGGGAFISATTATLTNNNITGNTGGGGSGGATIYASTAMLINNNFTGNSVATFTGAAPRSPPPPPRSPTTTSRAIQPAAGAVSVLPPLLPRSPTTTSRAIRPASAAAPVSVLITTPTRPRSPTTTSQVIRPAAPAAGSFSTLPPTSIYPSGSPTTTSQATRPATKAGP